MYVYLHIVIYIVMKNYIMNNEYFYEECIILDNGFAGKLLIKVNCRCSIFLNLFI